MSVYEDIDSFKESISSAEKGKRKEKLILYIEGLKSKIKQVEHALSKIKERSPLETSSTSREVLDTDEEIGFYCDSFWAFLYSCLDVLSQILNIKYKIRLKEDKVSFNEVHQHGSKLPAKIHNEIKNIRNSKIFRNLPKYRNCSLHRRHIAIYKESRSVSVSSGYTLEGASTGTEIVRLICDNPYELKPMFKQKRKIDEYCEKSKVKIFKHISNISQSMT